MVNKLILWAADNKKLEKIVSGSRLTTNTVQRFVAGAQLTDAINAAVNLNKLARKRLNDYALVNGR